MGLVKGLVRVGVLVLTVGVSPQGFIDAMSGFVKLGLIDSETTSLLQTGSPRVSWVILTHYSLMFPIMFLE